jgi:hypothetical protein
MVKAKSVLTNQIPVSMKKTSNPNLSSVSNSPVKKPAQPALFTMSYKQSDSNKHHGVGSSISGFSGLGGDFSSFSRDDHRISL